MSHRPDNADPDWEELFENPSVDIPYEVVPWDTPPPTPKTTPHVSPKPKMEPGFQATVEKALKQMADGLPDTLKKRRRAVVDI